MIDRKAALVGCRKGQWIRTHGMRGLRLNARIHESALLRIEQLDGTDMIEVTASAGVHKLQTAAWTRVEIIEGPHADALCLLETS